MKIGFSQNKSESGPAGFLSKLRESIEVQKLAKTSTCLNPFVTCNLFANKAYNFWFKPYIFRVDGITIDSKLGYDEINRRNSVIKEGISNANGVVFQTLFSKNLVRKILGLEPDNSTIIINGTNLETFSNVGDNKRAELGIPEGAWVFITSAKWRSHKRLKDIVQVFEEFKLIHKDSYLIVVGENDLITKSDSIKFLQRVPNRELPSYLRTANCYLFLSWLDTCPNSVIEAIACGVPVVCSNQGGTKEIIELTSGGIVSDADEPFNFDFVDLYFPPKVNNEKVIISMLDLYNNYNKYKANIKREFIDINYVAKKYIRFIESHII